MTSLYTDRIVPVERGRLVIQKAVGTISGVKPLNRWERGGMSTQ